MVGKFIWGVAWRSMAFAGVVGGGLWLANRGDPWRGADVVAAGDTKINGKVGVVVVALMQPEHFDQQFFSNFLNKLLNQVIPWPINLIAGADSGTVLVDPDHPFQQAPYDAARLIDVWGRDKDIDGVPWAAKLRQGQLRWEKPSATSPHDFGYYIFAERQQGMPTIAAKTAIKARAIYYPALPNGYLPHYSQTRSLAQGAIDLVKTRYPIVAGEVADAFDPYAKEQAIERVLDAGADTLIVASAQPVYSDFEELNGSFVAVHHTVEQWRKRHGGKPIKIVIPPYMGSRAGFDAMILAHFARHMPPASAAGQSAMGIFTLHGLPPSLVKTDSWSGRVAMMQKRLLPQMEAVLRAKGYAKIAVRFGSEGFADAAEDPKNQITSVNELYREAADKKMTLAVAVPLEFMAENTDSLFAHAALMFDGLDGYRTYMGPSKDVDWAKPYVRDYRLGQTRMMYIGAMGGAAVPQQSAVLADAIDEMLNRN